MDAKVELSKELRQARGWILGVGILMFAMDMLMTWVIHGKDYTQAGKMLATYIDLGVLAFFVAMFVLAARQPKLACVLALIGFWGLYIVLYAITGKAEVLYGGFLIKILFTAALIRGLKSASRAAMLQKDLEKVFE